MRLNFSSRCSQSVFSAVFAGAVCWGASSSVIYAQAVGVPIVEQSPEGFDLDEAKLGKLIAALHEEGKLLSVETLEAQMKSPVAEPITLKEKSDKLLDPEAVVRVARAGSVRIGWCYLCDSCDDWHLSLAGGYAISADGAVATCAHVIDAPPSKKASLVVADHDGNVFPVTKVLAFDELMDAAIVKVDHKLTPLALNADVRPGEDAFCFSSPLDQMGYFSRGMVNRFYWGRVDRGGDDTSLEALRSLRMNVSTPWAPGSSGSPVLDPFGNVIGHVSEIMPLSNASEEYKNGQDGSSPATLSDIDSSTPLITLHTAIAARSVIALAAVGDASDADASTASAALTPAEIYTKMSAHFTEGNPDAAVAIMNKESREAFLVERLSIIVDELALENEVPNIAATVGGEEIELGVKTLGLDTFEIPDWLRESPFASDEVEATHRKNLAEHIRSFEDAPHFMKALVELHGSITESEFGGTLIVAPEEAPAVDPGTIWVKLKSKMYGEETLPLSFIKSESGWNYKGIDHDSMDAYEDKVRGKKNISISGESLDGDTLSLSDYKDKVVLVDFWGTW